MIEIPIWLVIVAGILFGLGFIVILALVAVFIVAYRTGRKNRPHRKPPRIIL